MTKKNDCKNCLKLSLFFMRFSIFAVMLVWTLDKFLRPNHAATVFRAFYYLPAFGDTVFYVIGTLELILLGCFLLGFMKKYSYGLVLLFHFISTVSSFKAYFNPFQGAHILFFAAIPMLAACNYLYLVREEDTLFTIGKK